MNHRGQRSTFSIPIRAVLIVFPLVLLWGVYGVSAHLWQESSEATLRRHAGDMLEQLGSAARAHAEEYMAQASVASELTRQLLKTDVVDEGERTQLERYLLEQLSAHPDFAGAYYAGMDGELVYVSRAQPSEPGAFRTKLIRQGVAGRNVTLLWRDAAFELLSTERVEDAYEPRTRPWFTAATNSQAVVWNDPYIFYSSRMPGITLSGALRAPGGRPRGVVAVDIQIGALSEFIASLKVAENGRAMIVDRRRAIVAYPDLDALRVESPEGGMRLLTLDDLGDEVVSHIVDSLEGRDDGTGQELADFDVGRERFLVLSSMLGADGPAWTFCAYVPESDFLGPIREQLRYSGLVLLGATLLASLFGVLLSRDLARPLRRLRDEASIMQRHDFTSTASLRSVYREVRETGEAFTRMQRALRAYDEENGELLGALRQSQLDVIHRLAACAEYKDEDTALHLRRISGFATRLAKELGAGRDIVDLIGYASPMHDIGKMGIPDDVLQKPGRYTDEERKVMEQHPEIGSRILTPHDDSIMAMAWEIALCHHEKWDGTGYPRGLAGTDIPLSARIVALADVFDALTQKRCYKEAFPVEKAVEIIREGRGTHFDPDCVDAFLRDLGAFTKLVEFSEDEVS